MLSDLDGLPKPLIARVHGQAFGGGVGMMAVCDIVVAAAHAKFALTETRPGRHSRPISAPMSCAGLGEGNTRRVFMNGKRFRRCGGTRPRSGQRGCRRLTALDDAVEAEVSWFLDCAPGAVADAKALCLALSRDRIDDQHAFTSERLADRWETAEAQEGIRCFFDGEKPSWSRGRSNT